MRSIIGIALLLVGFGMASCQFEGTPAKSRALVPAAPWVRTIDGWERAGNWVPATSHRPQLHPLVVASGQLLAAALALAAFAPESRRS